MTAIISFLQSSVAYAVPMIVLLGLLIFFHELGHFLVAKYFKVRVEVFSLGFGPKILKFKKGDTVYAISALPLGGYVKMFGDDPTADVESEHRAVSLTHKPVGQRIAIVLAGPLMNFFLAIVLFAGVAFIGEPALAPKLGDIEAKSAAYGAGFRSGDTVKEADSKPVKSWDEFQKIIESHGDAIVPVTVTRATGEEEKLQVTPKQSVNKNVMSWDRHVGEIDGLSYASRSTLVGVRDANSIAAKAGIKTADMIVSVNGEKMTKWRELKSALTQLVGSKKPVALEIERGLLDENRKDDKGEIVKLELPIPTDAKNFEEMLAKVGLEYPELYLAGIEKNSPAAKAGLQKGDRLLAIDGQELSSFEQIAGIIRAFGQNAKTEDGQEPKPLSVTAERDGKPLTVAIAPNMKERMSQNGKEEKRFEIGIRPMIVDAAPATFEMTSSGIDALSRGFNQTMKWSSLTILGFVRMFQAEVSAKNIGGFLSIGQMAKKSWQMGPSQFLNIMAIISINLFILNLLPVPVLDGGHLVFYSIEALRGAPLSMRKMEIAQQVGLVLLLGLMVFALFNDVTRILN